MKKKVAILQSNYIPWKGYFDLMRRVDEFILYDDAQYTRRDWRNRNLIPTQKGLKWLTIPVEAKGNYLQKIKDTKITDPSWASNHWKTIRHNYAQSPYFGDYREILEKTYAECSQEKLLSAVNHKFINLVCKLLGISTVLRWSMDYHPLPEGQTQRLVGLCKAANANIYLSGPSAQAYIEEDLFRESEIELQYMDYSGYPPYRQLWEPFEHNVTVLDLIFNEGPHAVKFMKA